MRRCLLIVGFVLASCGQKASQPVGPVASASENAAIDAAINDMVAERERNKAIDQRRKQIENDLQETLRNPPVRVDRPADNRKLLDDLDRERTERRLRALEDDKFLRDTGAR